jgi:hypothetical protein
MKGITMSKSSIDRVAPLTGLAFAALLVAVRVIEGSGLPDAGESTAKVVAYWTQHQGEQMTVAVLASFAAVFFVWFAGVLRTTLRAAEGEGDTLAAISFGGAVIAAAGMLTITTVEYAAAHSAGDVPATVTQTLSALQADTFIGLAAGFGIFGVATGLAMVRTGAISTRLGWLSVVAGVLWLTPGEFLAIFLTVIFVVLVSIRLYRSEAPPRAALASSATH